ncbi:MAG: STAS domain-containing protein [Treponema sp.]|nr:STAS domain-containing protein [Treponema sp.]
MTITERKNETTVELVVAGRLDTTTAPQLESKLQECTQNMKTLLLDLQNVEYISSAGLRIVLLAHKMMTATGGQMSVRNPSPFCRQIFEATGMDAVLSFV